MTSVLSQKIAQLRSGDEIIILKGEGYLPVFEETEAIIAFVDGGSAICNDGTCISENCISDLIPTGRRYETYKVNGEAMRLWGLVLAARKEALDRAEKPDWSVPDPFATQPE